MFVWDYKVHVRSVFKNRYFFTELFCKYCANMVKQFIFYDQLAKSFTNVFIKLTLSWHLVKLRGT